MTKHVNTTTATGKAKPTKVNVGSQALPAGNSAPAPTDRYLADLFAAFAAAQQEHVLHFDSAEPDDGQAACTAAVGKMADVMEAICAYRPRANDRAAWSAFLLEQMDFFDSEARFAAAMSALVANVASTPPTVAFDSRAMTSPEVQMSVLVRSFRDAAITIDPTIRGFWIGNVVDDDEAPEGSTSFSSLMFDRRKDRKADFPKTGRRTYLASEKLEPLDLSELGLGALVELYHRLEDYRRAVDSFLSADAFHRFNDKGRAIGSTWNGEMVEAIRAWSEDAAPQIIDAIRAYRPATKGESYERAIFLIWWEAHCGGELNEVLSIVGGSVAEQQSIGDGATVGEPPSAALNLMSTFATLSEAEQQQLLAAARDIAAQKKAA